MPEDQKEKVLNEAEFFAIVNKYRRIHVPLDIFSAMGLKEGEMIRVKLTRTGVTGIRGKRRKKEEKEN